MFQKLKIKTSEKVEFIDITSRIVQEVRNSEIDNGIVVLNVPHTTAGLTINENADPDVKRDIINELNKIIPFNDNYYHMEGNSAAHIKSSLIGSSETVIIKDSKLQLGRWQAIYFCEFDGARTRQLNLKIIES